MNKAMFWVGGLLLLLVVLLMTGVEFLVLVGGFIWPSHPFLGFLLLTVFVHVLFWLFYAYAPQVSAKYEELF